DERATAAFEWLLNNGDIPQIEYALDPGADKNHAPPGCKASGNIRLTHVLRRKRRTCRCRAGPRRACRGQPWELSSKRKEQTNCGLQVRERSDPRHERPGASC